MIDDTILQEYLDGELDEAQRREVEALLAESAAARAQLAEWQALYAAFDGVTDVPLTTDLAGQVVGQIEGQDTAVSAAPWLRWLLLGQVIAAGVLIWQFLPLLQTWWGYGRIAFTLPQFQLPAFASWQIVTGWGAALLARLDNLPAFSLPLNQWLLVIAVVLIIWLAGNRLLFTSQDGGSHG
jgi:anti-sigma factor RsiW